MSLLQVERAGGLVTLTLNDPARRNLLSGELCAAISTAVAQASADPDARALVVTGAAPAFCAGAHLHDLLAAAEGRTAALDAVYKAFMDVAACPLPTLAAVNGAAVGAGFNLALACDMRIGSSEAIFDTRFLKIGLHPGGGHGWMLLRAIGWAAASRLLLAGQRVDAEEALRIGLVEAVTPPDALMERASSHLKDTLRTPRDLLVRTKASLRLAAGQDHAAAFAHENAEQRWSLGEPAFTAALAAFQAR